MDKRKVLLTAAIAGLFAAGAVMNQAAPVFADEQQGQTGDKASCKGGSCKGEEGAAKTDAGAPAGGEKKSEDDAGKTKKSGKHKGDKKKKNKKKAAEPTG